jgi:hypothetical protein
MPSFDSPGACFDAGLRFDQAVAVPPVPPITHQRMPKFKLDLTKKTPAQKIALGAAHVTAMTGNAAFPVATRLPTDAAFQAALDDLTAKEADVTAKETALKQARNARNASEAAFDIVLNSRAANCEAAQPTDDAALASTGLPLRPAPTTIGDLPAPGDLRASIGDDAGEIDLSWDPVYGANSYVIESKVHNAPGDWAVVKTVSQSKYTVAGLTSGTFYAFRVRALGPKGEGPWSDEAVKISP